MLLCGTWCSLRPLPAAAGRQPDDVAVAVRGVPAALVAVVVAVLPTVVSFADVTGQAAPTTAKVTITV